MTRRLLAVGVALVLIGGLSAVAYRIAKSKHCLIHQCGKKKLKVSGVCTPVMEAASQRKIDCDFEQKKISEVLKSLEAQGLNVVYKAPLAEQVDEVVTLRVKQMPVQAVAMAALKAAGLKYEVTEEKILIVLGR